MTQPISTTYDVIQAALTEYEYSRRAFFDADPSALADADEAKQALTWIREQREANAQLAAEVERLKAENGLLRQSYMARLAKDAEDDDRDDDPSYLGSTTWHGFRVHLYNDDDEDD